MGSESARSAGQVAVPSTVTGVAYTSRLNEVSSSASRSSGKLRSSQLTTAKSQAPMFTSCTTSPGFEIDTVMSASGRSRRSAAATGGSR